MVRQRRCLDGLFLILVGKKHLGTLRLALGKASVVGGMGHTLPQAGFKGSCLVRSHIPGAFIRHGHDDYEHLRRHVVDQS